MFVARRRPEPVANHAAIADDEKSDSPEER